MKKMKKMKKIYYTKIETIKKECCIEIENDCFLKGKGFMGVIYFLGIFENKGRTHKILLNNSNDYINYNSTELGSFDNCIRDFCKDKKNILKLSENDFFSKIKNLINKINQSLK